MGLFDVFKRKKRNEEIFAYAEPREEDDAGLKDEFKTNKSESKSESKAAKAPAVKEETASDKPEVKTTADTAEKTATKTEVKAPADAKVEKTAVKSEVKAPADAKVEKTAAKSEVKAPADAKVEKAAVKSVDKVTSPKTESKPTKPTTAKEKKPNTAQAIAKSTASSSPKPAQKQVTEAPKEPATVADEIENEDKAFGGETVSETKQTRTGKFEIKKAKDGRYVFNLYSSNRVIVARSQIYSSSSSAVTGIKSVITNAPKANMEDTTLKKPVTASFPKWEIYLDKAGQYRFRLYAANGSCICHSRGYTTKSSCKSGIESIIRLATDAKIDKIYLDNK